MGDLEDSPGTWLQTGLALVLVAIWGLNQQLEGLSLIVSPL